VIGFPFSRTEQQATEVARVYAGDLGGVKPIAASSEKALPCRDWRLALPAD
jgi:hypothetical protein